mmetsp:Transcript_6688/g.13390  ORF Transcript_6688/g.13390 Transcript_6688/m.13390 type:complete len:199 (-) Transcript_6688:164-760(-)
MFCKTAPTKRRNANTLKEDDSKSSFTSPIKRRKSSPIPLARGAPWYILPPSFIPTPTNITAIASQTGASSFPSNPSSNYYSPLLACILSTPPSSPSGLYTLTHLKSSATVTVEHHMGRIYIAHRDVGFGSTVDDIVAHGLEYLQGSLSLPNPQSSYMLPSISSLTSCENTLEGMSMDEEESSLDTDRNRRRSFGYDNI